MNQKTEIQSGISDFLIPCMDSSGAWMSAGGLAVKISLTQGSLSDALDVLNKMNAAEIGTALSETGFGFSGGITEADRDNLLIEVQRDLTEAASLQVDGFGLDDWRLANGTNISPMCDRNLHDFAAKGFDEKYLKEFGSLDFVTDISAAIGVQKVMSSSEIKVDLLGDAKIEERSSLLFIAGQALQKGVQGFAFDGIPGKYEVPLSMAEMVALNHHAAKSVALESARTALGEWVDDKKVTQLSEWVPDSIQQLFRSSVSLSAASTLVNAIEGGSIAKHAGGIGTHAFGRLMSENGINVNAVTVAQQAVDQGLTLIEPDSNRGLYVGPVVGMDHRAYLIKYSREKAVELPFKDLPKDIEKPNIGDSLRLKFKGGEVTVAVAERTNKDIGR